MAPIGGKTVYSNAQSFVFMVNGKQCGSKVKRGQEGGEQEKQRDRERQIE